MAWMITLSVLYNANRYTGMKAIPKLKMAMTPFPYSIELDASLDEAMALMAKHEVRHLPVTDGHIPAGMISDRDIRGVALVHAGQENAGVLRVRDVYVTEVYIVDLNEPLDNVLLHMADGHIGSAVVTREGRLAGVFTAMDACRTFGEYLRERFPHGDGDEAA